MGQYANRLRKKLARDSAGLPTTTPKRSPGEPLPGGVADIQTLIERGYDPIHAAYITIQNLTSHFAEGVSQLPEKWRNGYEWLLMRKTNTCRWDHR